MKTKNFLFAVAFLLMAGFAFAKEGDVEIPPEQWATINEKVAEQYHFGVLHNWGASWASITRIQKKDNVSNFVWNDKMIGAFYEVQSHDLLTFSDLIAINFTGRLAVYYPYNYTFRKVPQMPTQVLLYAFDVFTAPVLTLNFHDRVRIDLEFGLHLLYQLNDMWHYFHIGPGAKLDVEFPVSPRWTVLLGGMFSWDNGNYGNNGTQRPFDYTWEYQVQIGARCSMSYLNRNSYITYKPKKPKVKRVRGIKTLSKETDIVLDEEGNIIPPEELEKDEQESSEEAPKEEEPKKEEPAAPVATPTVRR